MRCVACGSSAVSERLECTVQGYRRFRCRTCGKQFNERSAGLLNRTQYPSDIIALVVLWRLRYKLSLRDLAEMFLVRGILFSYEAVRDWEAKLRPALAETLRRRRRGKVGRSCRRECAAASGVGDGGRSPAIGLQEQVANHRKRRGSKARVVSVTEKAPRGVRWETGRRTTVNCRSSVESAQTTSKPVSDVAPGSVWPIPAYGPGGVRHRGSAILFQALTLNRGNLRRRCEAKGTSRQGEADSSDAPPRDGAARSSDEAAVTVVERRGGVIQRAWGINRATGRNPP